MTPTPPRDHGLQVGGPDDPARDLLGAYAVDAVDDLERRTVERLVAHDEDAALELAALREAAASLGAAHASAPPAEVRADVLARIARTPQEAGPTQTADGTDRSAADPARSSTRSGDLPPATTDLGAARRARRPWAAVAAAAVLVAVALPSGLAWQQHERAVQAEQQSAAVADVLAEPGAQVVREDVAGGGTAVAVLGAEQAVLLVDGLAGPASGSVYQLWAMRDGTPVPAGFVDPRDGSGQALATDYRPGDGLAVSVEPAGGSATPTTTPVVVLLPG